MSHLNDNLYHNLRHMSIIHYDTDITIHKHEIPREKKAEIASKFAEQ